MVEQHRSPPPRRPVQLELLPGARVSPLPGTLAPMLPTLVDQPFSDPNWLFEPKLDGVRIIALIQDKEVRLLSRRGLDTTRQYPAVAQALVRGRGQALALDGEIVALDSQGRPSFHLLQQRLGLTRDQDIRWADAQIPLVYYAFDLLHFDGYDLQGTPLERRRELLEQVLVPLERVQPLAAFPGVGQIAYQSALDHGFEGIVAKRRGSRCAPGKRSQAWLKVKGTCTDEFVIGGYSAGSGSRTDTFGALLVGGYDAQGALRYVGHVGTGFDQPLLQALRERLDGIRADRSPFADRVTTHGRSGVHGRSTWVRPALVAEVKFAERTPDRKLRAPVFLRIREDKVPAEAVLPTAIAGGPGPAQARLPLPEAEEE